MSLLLSDTEKTRLSELAQWRERNQNDVVRDLIAKEHESEAQNRKTTARALKVIAAAKKGARA